MLNSVITKRIISAKLLNFWLFFTAKKKKQKHIVMLTLVGANLQLSFDFI